MKGINVGWKQTFLRGCNGNKGKNGIRRLSLAECDRASVTMPRCTPTLHIYQSIHAGNWPDHVRKMSSSRSTLCNQMPVSPETLGGDVLLEVVSWLSRFDLLNFVMTVRSSVPAQRRVSVPTILTI